MGIRQRRAGSAVTLLDVARHAGVSPMTASRVINRHPRVSATMRERVEASIQALGYRPNLAGRSLRTAGLARIGVLYSNPSAAYLNQFMLGVLERSSLEGCQVLVEKSEDSDSQRAATERLLDAGADGLILPPPLCESKAIVGAFVEAGIPVVAIASSRFSDKVSCVRIDDRRASHDMVSHLIAHGHTRIGYITGDPNQTASAHRWQGYRDALAEAGIGYDAALVQAGDFTYRAGLEAAERLLALQPRPSAIFASNDDMASAVVSVAHRRRLKVPEDLSVVGFDDTSASTMVWPELTTIHQPVADMTDAAIDLLLREIRQAAGAERVSVNHVVPHRLITRDSVSRPLLDR